MFNCCLTAGWGCILFLVKCIFGFLQNSRLKQISKYLCRLIFCLILYILRCLADSNRRKMSIIDIGKLFQ